MKEEEHETRSAEGFVESGWRKIGKILNEMAARQTGEVVANECKSTLEDAGAKLRCFRVGAIRGTVGQKVSRRCRW